tara:strand:+ start:9481 stop:9753 length:273 start_codon:yes stop_codon:yes gene_type:complete
MFKTTDKDYNKNYYKSNVLYFKDRYRKIKLQEQLEASMPPDYYLRQYKEYGLTIKPLPLKTFEDVKDRLPHYDWSVPVEDEKGLIPLEAK